MIPRTMTTRLKTIMNKYKEPVQAVLSICDDTKTAAAVERKYAAAAMEYSCICRKAFS